MVGLNGLIFICWFYDYDRQIHTKNYEEKIFSLSNLKLIGKSFLAYLIFILEMLITLWISFYLISNYNIEGKVFHILSVIITGFAFFFLTRVLLKKFTSPNSL